MNCLEGDIAVIVRSKAGNEGTIVQCLKFVGKSETNPSIDDYWEVQVLKSTKLDKVTLRMISDSLLKPLRLQEGEDQTITWAGKPPPLGE